MLKPSSGTGCTLLATVGAGMPAASSTVGATSMTWQNWLRISPLLLMPFGSGRWSFWVPPQLCGLCPVRGAAIV
jgi:hypothetical protein